MVLYRTTYDFVGDFRRGTILTPTNPWWYHSADDDFLVWIGPSHEEIVTELVVKLNT